MKQERNKPLPKFHLQIFRFLLLPFFFDSIQFPFFFEEKFLLLLKSLCLKNSRALDLHWFKEIIIMMIIIRD